MPITTRRMSRMLEVWEVAPPIDGVNTVDGNETVVAVPVADNEDGGNDGDPVVVEPDIDVIIITDDEDDVSDGDYKDECPICTDMKVLVIFCENRHLFCRDCLRNDMMARGREIDEEFIEQPCMICRQLVIKHFCFFF